MTTVVLVLALIATPNAGSTSRDLVILDFHASWCGPCQQMRPAIEQLTQSGYPIKSVDLDRAPGLAKRYGVQSVPTFIVVDGKGRELGRTQGLQPAAQLASLYKQAQAKVASSKAEAPAPAPKEPEPASEDAAASADQDDDEESEAPTPAARLPKPWETVVRIRVDGGGMIEFGSGTIISSTPEESIVLTCAHIFKIQGARTQPAPSRFPRKLTIDLFDGQLHGTRPAMVHYVGSVAGEAIDYDFTSDVGLIRIRPGRKLAAARVVPPHWTPKPRMEMITVGCSEGHDATAWTTWIVNPRSTLKVGGRLYEAIECVHAPKQGRSGGGLYTTDGYVAGVCDFAEPTHNQGLYAAPQAIYRMLDRNKLMALYNPKATRPDRLLAQNGRGSKPAARPSQAHTLRAQSPDPAEAKRVTLPAPEMLGIDTPAVASAEAASARSGKPTWKPSGGSDSASTTLAAARTAADEPPVETEIEVAPSAAGDPFTPEPPAETERSTAPPTSTSAGSRSRGQGRWRTVRPVDPAIASGAR